MSTTVFANGRSVACKGGSGESLAAFPNVCFTPPQTPPTPLGVPLPYPNTGSASKTKSGSKKVVICGKEVMIRDSSHFAKSTGSEAGRAPKKGILTSKNNGGTQFVSWSFDVDIEGKGAPRHLDVTTYNHGSMPGNGATWIFKDRVSMGGGPSGPCAKEEQAVADNCKQGKGGAVKCPALKKGQNAANAKKVQKNKCQRAARCMLVPWQPRKGQGKCCPPQTPHHLIPKSCFFKTSIKAGQLVAGAKSYNASQAPCICVEGGKSSATHGLFHAAHARDLKNLKGALTFGKATDIACSNVKEVLKSSGCSEACIRAQLKKGGHEGISDSTPLNPKSQNPKDVSKFKAEWDALEATL